MANSVISKKDPIVGHIFASVGDAQQTLGMGLTSDAYRLAMVMELGRRNIPYTIRPRVQAFYRGSPTENIVLNPDILVADRIPMNVVATAREELRMERRKIRTVVTLSRLPFGFVFNFDETNLNELITTIESNG